MSYASIKAKLNEVPTATSIGMNAFSLSSVCGFKASGVCSWCESIQCGGFWVLCVHISSVIAFLHTYLPPFLCTPSS